LYYLQQNTSQCSTFGFYKEKNSMYQKRLSRREMLKLMGLTAGGVAAASLTGCAPATPVPPTSTPLPTVTAAPTPTVVNANVITTGKTAATIEEGQAQMGWYEEWHPSSTVELLLWGPSGSDTDPWIAATKAMLDRFQKKYPEIKVTMEQIPGTDLDAKVSAAATAEEGPDVIAENDREAQFPRDKIVKPIPEDVLSPEFIKQHNFYEVRPLDDGLLYWVHTGIMGPILYCNKALLAEKGYKPADTPTKWDDFGKFCQELTKVEGDQMTQAGFSFNKYARYIWDDMMYQQKAHVYDKTKSNIDSTESANAWQMLLDFYDKYKINDRAFLQFDEAFGKGKSAFSQVWTWFGATLEANYPDIDWAPVTYPTFTGEGPYGRHDYDGPMWMVTTFAKGDKEKAAWELLKYSTHEYQWLVEKANTGGLAVSTIPHPDYTKIFNDVAAMDKPSQADRRLQSLAVLAKQFEGGMVFPGEVAAPFDNMWQKMEEAILYNNKPIKDTLVEYQKQYDEMLAQTNFWITPEA
jgi:multiple sugar transport system substrate-binding protein